MATETTEATAAGARPWLGLADRPLDRRALLRAGVLGGGALLGGGGLVSGLAGCGSPVELAPKGNAVPPTLLAYDGVAPDLPGTPEGVPDGYLNYPASPARVVTTPPGDGSRVTAMVNTYSPVPPGPASNAYWSELNTRLGYDMRMQVVPAADFGSKFSTVVAGGGLPDLLQLAATPLLPLLLQTKCVDLTEHLSGPAAAERYPFLAGLGEDTWTAGIVNGRIYGVPSPRGTFSSSHLFRRDDLLAEKGITGEPADFSELLGHAQEMTDPQGNRWAFAGLAFDVLAQMTGVPNFWRLQDDGGLVSRWEGEEQERAIELGRQLLGAGVVHPDWNASSSQKQWVGNGTCIYHQDSYPAWEQFYRENTAGPSFDIGAMLAPQADGGGPARTWRSFPAFGTSVVTKGNEHRIEGLLEALDWMAAPFGTEEYLFRKYGVAGVHYELDGTNPALNPRGAAETALGLTYLTDSPRVIYIPGFDGAVRKQYAHMAAVTPQAQRNPVMYLYSETESRYGKRLEGQLTSVRNDVVTGRAGFREWRDAVSDWRKGGGDDMRAELRRAREETPADLRPLT